MMVVWKGAATLCPGFLGQEAVEGSLGEQGG